ncbi:MAG: hypothetical protein HYT94_04365 [Parcubacteria group bacterium]|nr:hypothetical protein [Parcubacteria group bacterium]
MSKYNYTANQAEALINIVGGMESMERVLRGESKVDVNTVYPKLGQIAKLYGDKLLSEGVLILGDNSYRGVRDIIFSFHCVGSEEEAYFKLKETIFQTGFQFKEDFSKFSKYWSLCTDHKPEKMEYVSLRNTLEFTNGWNGLSFCKAERARIHTPNSVDRLSGRDLCCFLERYLVVFSDILFRDDPVIPVIFCDLSGSCMIGCKILTDNVPDFWKEKWMEQ